MALASTPGMDIPDTEVCFTPVLEKLPLRCFEIMRQPVHNVTEASTVQTAARLMRDADIGLLPVCDAHGVVVGIITDRDITARVCATNDPPAQTAVSRAMSRGVIACHPDDPVVKAERLMREHRITRILITDPSGRPVGIISLSDLVQYEPAGRVKRTLQTIAERKYAPERP